MCVICKFFSLLRYLDISLDKEEALMYYWLQEQQEGRDGDTRGRGAGAGDRAAAGGEEQVSRYPQLLRAGCLVSGLLAESVCHLRWRPS